MGSFSLSGGVEVFGFISPSNTADQYPVIDPLYGIDGLRNVDLLSDLDSIPLLRRRTGMVVGVSGTTYYKLNSPPWTFTFSDWSIFSPGSFTGGTVTGDTIFTNGLTATTFSASTYLGLPSDVFVSGYSYSNNTFTIERSFGNPNLSTTINDVTGLTINGDLIVTGTTFSDIISATTYQNLPLDVFVTGGTFSGGVITFENNSGGTFGVSGISSFDTFVTGFTYNDNTFTIFQNSGNSFSVLVDTFTGLTVNGDLNVTGTTYTDSISAGTYQNLPLDVFVTGGTYSTGTATFTNNSGGTFNVNGFLKYFISATTPSGATDGDRWFNTNDGRELVYVTDQDGSQWVVPNGTSSFFGSLSATTISATTYLNLPIDPDTYVTGFSYNNNEFIISDNSGNTFNAVINDVTGLTVNGGLIVTGSSTLDGVITSVSLSGVTDRMVQVDSGGTLTATTEIINAYISSASTVATQLSNISNWDINGNYIGSTITGTFQGQRYYDNNYFFEAIEDNLFIRLIRG
jgi:hypothetical protein